MKLCILKKTVFLSVLAVCFAAPHSQDRATFELHGALWNGNETKAKELIESGADLSSEDKSKWNPLHIASYRGLNKTVELLLSKGSDIDAKNDVKNTPLHLAVWENRQEVVQILIERGADIHVKNDAGKEPIDFANDKNLTNIAELFQEAEKYQITRRACQTYSTLPSQDVYGGSPAETGEFPWMAALGYIKLNANYSISFECGGTIISQRFILTAAHCTKESHPPILVRLGKLNLKESGATDYQIKRIIRHPNYSHETVTNDIALIEVIGLIVLTFEISPACLYTNLRDESSDVNLIVAGWGRTERGIRSDALLKTELKTMPLSECNRTYIEYNQKANHVTFQNGIGHGQYCAYDPTGRNDSCRGDSGGPLQVFPIGAHTARVVGIVSFGVECGTLPTIYTRVAYYLEWIQTHVWPNGELD